MEKTLEVLLQEEREKIAKEIEGFLSFYLRRNADDVLNPNYTLGFAQALAYAAQRIREKWSLDSASPTPRRRER